VGAFVAIGGAVLAFVLGHYNSGTGSVDRFAVDVVATSGTDCAEENDPAGVGSCAHTDPAAEVTLAGVYDTYAAIPNVNLKNNGTTDLVPTGLTIVTDAAAGALGFTYHDYGAGSGLCKTLSAGGPARGVAFEVEVLDASLLTGAETIAYRVDLEESGAACTEPATGTALTVVAP
jgi:hypothetical protein